MRTGYHKNRAVAIKIPCEAEHLNRSFTPEVNDAYEKLFDFLEYADQRGMIDPEAVWQVSSGEITLLVSPRVWRKRLKAKLIPFLYKTIGKAKTYRLIADGEYSAAKKYQTLVCTFADVRSVMEDESRHGDTVMALI